MNIKKTKLPDGKEGITIYADPDVISEMVALCKQRNIPVDESPEISSETIEQLSKIKKDVQKNSEIEKVFKMAEDLKNKNNVSENLTPQNILKNLIKGKQ